MKRRAACAAPLISGIALLVAACGNPPEALPDPPAPYNVVLMLIDTLRADRLGLYGYQADTSPHIDRLAAETVVFERAHSAAPWTLPSVVSLMLSMPLCEHNVLYDGQKIHDTARTLADRLHGAGYSTGAFFSNPYAGEMSGLDRGFDISQLVTRPNDGRQVDEWLDRYPDKPFFLYLHNMAPHNPSRAEPRHLQSLGYRVAQETRKEISKLLRRYRRLTRVDFVNGRTPGATDNTADQRQVMERLADLGDALSRLYDAQVRADDERVGSVVSALRRRGVWDDTLFILLSDHGEEMYEHGGWQHDQSVYEELIHVPLIVKLPDGRHGGRRIRQPVSLLDVLPTVMQVVGREELAFDCRGESLLPLLRSAGARRSGGRVTSMRHNQKKYYRPFQESRGNVNAVIVEDQWKGIYNLELSSFELYDLAADPAESEDLSAREAQRAQAMQRVVQDYYRECISRQQPPSSAGGELSREQQEALRSLGYVQ